MVYQDVAVLETIYVFKGQLWLATDSLSREESLLYMAVNHSLNVGHFRDIAGFHWLDED